jgi:hypothetical protein
MLVSIQSSSKFEPLWLRYDTWLWHRVWFYIKKDYLGALGIAWQTVLMFVGDLCTKARSRSMFLCMCSNYDLSNCLPNTRLASLKVPICVGFRIKILVLHWLSRQAFLVFINSQEKFQTIVINQTTTAASLCGEEPCNRCYGHTSALRLILQPCDEVD